MLIDYCFSLPAAQIVAQYLTWLMLITIAIGKYLMNGYSVVKEQPIHRYSGLYSHIGTGLAKRLSWVSEISK